MRTLIAHALGPTLLAVVFAGVFVMTGLWFLNAPEARWWHFVVIVGSIAASSHAGYLTYAVLARVPLNELKLGFWKGTLRDLIYEVGGAFVGVGLVLGTSIWLAFLLVAAIAG